MWALLVASVVTVAGYAVIQLIRSRLYTASASQIILRHRRFAEGRAACSSQCLRPSCGLLRKILLAMAPVLRWAGLLLPYLLLAALIAGAIVFCVILTRVGSSRTAHDRRRSTPCSAASSSWSCTTRATPRFDHRTVGRRFGSLSWRLRSRRRDGGDSCYSSAYFNVFSGSDRPSHGIIIVEFTRHLRVRGVLVYSSRSTCGKLEKETYWCGSLSELLTAWQEPPATKAVKDQRSPVKKALRPPLAS